MVTSSFTHSLSTNIGDDMSKSDLMESNTRGRDENEFNTSDYNNNQYVDWAMYSL